METVIIVEGLWFWREPRGLYEMRVTSYPTYTKGKVVAFNLCSFPRNATDKADLAQFPTPSATIRSEDPREGAPRVLKCQRTPREWKIKECFLIWHVSHVNGKTQILVEYRIWASHDVGPTSPKPSSPTKKSGSRILRGYCGAREFMAQAHSTSRPKA